MTPPRTPGARRTAKACAAAALGLSLALSSGLPALAQTFSDSAREDSLNGASSTSSPGAAVTPEVADATGNIAVFVQFKGKGAFETTQPRAAFKAGGRTQNKAAQTQAIASAVESQSQQVADQSGAEVLYTTHNALRGAAIQGDAEQIKKLAERSDVAKISRIVPKKRANSGTDVDTGALKEWTQTGQTGKDVTIAVIDSGLDYTHADFGGPGTKEAYAKAKASKDLPAKDSGLYDPKKFVGGWDLAGDAYDAESDDAADQTPQEDSNPLDCSSGSGHGTHVAGTAVGYGVGSDGKTWKGDYTKLTEDQVKGMKIGPGSAPDAKITSLRVFGCEGTTNLVGAALDRSLDPNGDGDFADRANIASISIGADFGPSDDPENDIVNALSRAGVLSVIAAGNAGDSYNVYGNPGSAESALTVANSQGSTAGTDQVEVTGPADVAGKYSASYSGSYDYTRAKPEALQGTVTTVPADNKYGCKPFTGQNFAGKWVYLDWADDATGQFPCGSKVRFDNAAKAGAQGVVLTSDVELEDSGIAGNATIPGFRFPKSAVDKVKSAAEAGTLRVRMGEDLIGAGRIDSGSLDVVNTSSSRGEHGSTGYTKPDLAAPGTSIISAGVGSGNGPKEMTGTSMATPHTSGIAALVLQKHRDWTPQNVKAALMNTAVHDVKSADGTSSVERVGSGRVDAAQAVDDDVLVYQSARPDLVSQSFGVVEAKGGKQTYQREITVDNTGSATHTFDVSFAGSTSMPGVSFSFDPTVSVAPGGKKTFVVTATVDTDALEKTQDPGTEKTQLGRVRQYIATLSGRLELKENGRELRLPLQIAPKPVSDLKADSTTIDVPSGQDSADVKITGTALDRGGWTSALGAFELGASSGRIPTQSLPANSVQGADLQYVGASSSIPSLAAAGKDAAAGKIGFGISTWGSLSALTPSTQVEVAVDADGNGRADHVVLMERAEGLDYPLASLYSLSGDGKLGSLLDQQPVNGSWGDQDTNTLDTNAFVLPVDASKLGIRTGDAKQQISYRVFTGSWLARGDVDSTDWISYNPVKPALWFSSDATFNDVLLKDRAGTVRTHRNGSDAAKGLFLHLHNGTGDLSGITAGEDGGRAEVLTTRTEPKPTDGNNGNDARFKDVKKGDQFYDEITWLANRNITTGYPDGTFRPLDNVERGAMAAYFYRLAGSPQFTPPSTSPFKDVKPSDQFYKEITWLASQKITTGYADGTFRATDPVNRDAMAAFFYRYAGSPDYSAPKNSPFKDLKPSDQFYKEITWMASQKITTGWEDGTYRPLSPIHRDAMAAFIFRYDKNVLSKK